jgi:hypothetical protein
VRVHPLAPVVGVDIDGFMADYHSHFIWFCNNIYWPGRGLVASWSLAHGEFEIALGLNKEEYRAAKLAYRLGGLKRCLPLFQNDWDKNGKDAIISEIQYIRSLGVQVWVCTQRPWLALTTVDNDTQYWLDRWAGRIDGLIYGEDKYQDLLDIVGRERILGVGDDLPENIERATQLGLRTVMRENDHNRYWLKGCNPHQRTILRIKDLSSVVEGWMEENK